MKKQQPSKVVLLTKFCYEPEPEPEAEPESEPKSKSKPEGGSAMLAAFVKKRAPSEASEVAESTE